MGLLVFKVLVCVQILLGNTTFYFFFKKSVCFWARALLLVIYGMKPHKVNNLVNHLTGNIFPRHEHQSKAREDFD